MDIRPEAHQPSRDLEVSIVTGQHESRPSILHSPSHSIPPTQINKALVKSLIKERKSSTHCCLKMDIRPEAHQPSRDLEVSFHTGTHQSRHSTLHSPSHSIPPTQIYKALVKSLKQEAGGDSTSTATATTTAT